VFEHKTGYGKALALYAVLAVTGAVFLGCRPAFWLEIRDAESGKPYRRFPLDDGGEFAVEFVHSVNQSPVREIFAAGDGKILARAVRFFSFGAGMQSDLEEGMTMGRDGDALVITYPSGRSFDELRYIVGTVSDHLLLVGGETVSLRELCGRNAHIVIRVKRSLPYFLTVKLFRRKQ
jgi:hypothetical protein